MVPLVNPGAIYSGAIRACHLYVLIYDMGRLLPISEPHFGWLLQKKKRKYIECCHWLLKGSAYMTVLALLDRVDHVDFGELGGLSDRAGGWKTVPRRSALPCGLLPGPEWSHLQLLQSRSGPAAVCAEPASGPTLPGRWPLRSWLLLHPHCLRDLQLLPVPRGCVMWGWPPLLPPGLPLQR